MNLIFVYGTLMSGECRHAALLESIAGPGAGARVRGLLMNLGDYPALVGPGEPSAGWVHGECYRLEDRAGVLAALDEIEGGEYVRREVEVELENGAAVRAWTYVWRGDRAPGPAIMSGDWRQR